MALKKVKLSFAGFISIHNCPEKDDHECRGHRWTPGQTIALPEGAIKTFERKDVTYIEEKK